ncbi:hypothetical protein A1O3_10515 [Capronia epimyces CBS 606.96]|uniref:Uncharacterized protein n=1 Tax=Capronia epimyces CBS 606.96 TaxID=1182542 RepID=W9XHR6_9EURO|nr:uncharacterized protein A1O3_10515 [Capronia epimyces CBS 606.96]EXJ76870.1 hypothetical protein A1O3_10515 [Capronia epimyces CBS 606.96]
MSETHVAAVLEAVGQPLSLKTLPIPQAVTGSATVRVLATALSPNSKDVFSGCFGPLGVRTPVTPSAACIGRIHSVGPDATSLKPGQLVFTDFWTPSRDDPDNSILAGYMGGADQLEAVWNQGTFAQYASVPLERVWSLNESLLCDSQKYTPAELVYLGNLCIAFAGLLDINVRPGDSVIAAPATGTFGGAAVHAAIALGARVIACGRNEQMLARMADAFGPSGRLTTVTLSGNVEIDTTAIKSAAGGKGADKYIDFSPPRAQGTTHLVSCISALRSNAKASLMGTIFGNVEIPYYPLIKNNISIQGRLMFERHHVDQVLKLLESGHLSLGNRPNSGMRIQTFKLPDIDKAIDEAAKVRGWGEYIVIEP